MPLIRSSVSKRLTCCFKLVAVILSLSKVMPTCSRCIEKGLVCVAIIALSSRQPSSCTRYTKLNIYLSCDIRLISNTKYP